MEIPGFVSEAEVRAARKNWSKRCNDTLKVLGAHARRINRDKEESRDSSLAIEVVASARNPYVEYYKIATEILKQLPQHGVDEAATAESIRSYLMIRFGLHLGLRQKNLRELLVCLPNETPRSNEKLARLKRGEIRWRKDIKKWEVYIPHTAFKNAISRFFRNKAWSYLFDDSDDLYLYIEAYINSHRNNLLAGAKDPSTFFVKLMRDKHCRYAAYTGQQFYREWRRIIQVYGILNPFTGRGAIEGLKVHGPHQVREILALQILKDTHDLTLAGYAIQDTPESVEKYYARLRPSEKAEHARNLLNAAWTRSKNAEFQWRVAPASLAKPYDESAVITILWT
jgi:hypothetical protein